MAIAFITWLWGSKYNELDVRKLVAGVRRNYRGDFRFVVFSERTLDLPPPIEVKPIADSELIGRSCFCRLRMFDDEWQEHYGFDDRIVSLDLDLIVCGDIAPVVERPESFLILQGANAANPCPFNGSVMMLRAGQHAEVWQDFTPDKANEMPYHKFPDDQGWIWHKLPGAAGWKVGQESGVYAFQKPGWPPGLGDALPPNARMVAFFGWRKPEMFASRFPWIAQHWHD